MSHDRKEESFMSQVTIHIERQSDGVYLATSKQVRELAAHGRTMIEALEAARNIVRSRSAS